MLLSLGIWMWRNAALYMQYHMARGRATEPTGAFTPQILWLSEIFSPLLTCLGTQIYIDQIQDRNANEHDEPAKFPSPLAISIRQGWSSAMAVKCKESIYVHLLTFSTTVLSSL
jgi:hypothetical protein